MITYSDLSAGSEPSKSPTTLAEPIVSRLSAAWAFSVPGSANRGSGLPADFIFSLP